MADITIDGKQYDSETLSDAVKAQLSNLQFVDQEIARAQAQVAILQTARNVYAQTLKAELEK